VNVNQTMGTIHSEYTDPRSIDPIAKMAGDVYKVSKSNFQPYIPKKPEGTGDALTYEKYIQMNDDEKRSVKNRTPAPSRKIVIKDAY